MEQQSNLKIIIILMEKKSNIIMLYYIIIYNNNNIKKKYVYKVEMSMSPAAVVATVACTSCNPVKPNEFGDGNVVKPPFK